MFVWCRFVVFVLKVFGGDCWYLFVYVVLGVVVVCAVCVDVMMIYVVYLCLCYIARCLLYVCLFGVAFGFCLFDDCVGLFDLVCLVVGVSLRYDCIAVLVEDCGVCWLGACCFVLGFVCCLIRFGFGIVCC